MSLRRDQITLHDGTTLSTHGTSQCQGRHCPIHNPSNHPLRNAPQAWQGELGYMQRVCSHGQYHADPDDWKVQLGHVRDACDGCCRHSVIDGEVIVARDGTVVRELGGGNGQ